MFNKRKKKQYEQEQLEEMVHLMEEINATAAEVSQLLKEEVIFCGLEAAAYKKTNEQLDILLCSKQAKQENLF